MLQSSPKNARHSIAESKPKSRVATMQNPGCYGKTMACCWIQAQCCGWWEGKQTLNLTKWYFHKLWWQTERNLPISSKGKTEMWCVWEASCPASNANGSWSQHLGRPMLSLTPLPTRGSNRSNLKLCVRREQVVILLCFLSISWVSVPGQRMLSILLQRRSSFPLLIWVENPLATS